MTAEEFAMWLEQRLLGNEKATATADLTSLDQELVNGELRPCVTAFFPEGAFVISVKKVSM